MLQRKLKAALAVPGEKRSDRFFRLFPWVWLAAAYCVTMLVLCLYGRNYIDSDMASDMVLAELLNQEGGVLSTQWWYSTELNVFCEQLVYRLGLALFPGDWYAARMMGQAFLLLLLILSYLYVGHGLRLKNCGAWGAAALACPFGLWYWWYGPFGGFYFPYMILLLLGFGSMLHLLRPAGKRRRILQWGFLLLVTGASGLNGLKGLMGFFVPMALTACLALGLQWHLEPDKRPRRESRLLVMAVLSLIVASAAYVFNSVFLTATHQYSNYNDRLWGSMNLETLLNKWMDFLSLFGYPVDSFLQGEVELFSLQGILGAFGLLTAGAIVFSLVRLLWRWKELDPVQRLAPLLLFSVCIVQGVVFAWTGDVFSANASYWLTPMPLVFFVLQLEGETEHFRIPHARRAAALAFCVCIVATSVSSGMRFFSSGYRTNPHLAEVCSWLEDEGYTQGYASFWNGNVLTEWSNGQIEVWVSNDFNTLKPYQWLQKTSHAQPPEGPVFLLTTMEELNGMNLTQLYWWSDVVYEDGEEIEDRSKRYVVMSYESYADLQAAVAGAQSWEAEGRE